MFRNTLLLIVLSIACLSACARCNDEEQVDSIEAPEMAASDAVFDSTETIESDNDLANELTIESPNNSMSNRAGDKSDSDNAKIEPTDEFTRLCQDEAHASVFCTKLRSFNAMLMKLGDEEFNWCQKYTRTRNERRKYAKQHATTDCNNSIRDAAMDRAGEEFERFVAPYQL